MTFLWNCPAGCDKFAQLESAGLGSNKTEQLASKIVKAEKNLKVDQQEYILTCFTK